MNKNLRNIHIGERIKQKTEELNIPMERICKFMKMNEEEIIAIYSLKTVETDILLKWCKLLEYDFFRLYVTHLMLFDSISHTKAANRKPEGSNSIEFRKNIYTKEIKDFIMELINTKQKTPRQIINEYHIPKTTIYKWVRKQEEI